MGKKNVAYINGEMLKWAREQTPFLSTDMVELEKPKISSSNLSKWENGEDYPSITEAKALASLYRVPFACFYLSEIPPKKPRLYYDRRTERLDTSVYDDISYALWSEIQRIMSDRDSILEWADVDYPEAVLPSVSNESVVDTAKTIREYFEMSTPLKSKSAYGSNPFSYYRNIIERKNIIVSQISGVSTSEMKGISLSFDEYPIIGINNQDFDNAKVFSLFHEIAHIFRRSSSLCLIDFDEKNDAEEKICDSIAAEVLMPRTDFIKIAREIKGVSSKWDPYLIEKLGGRFGVSSVSVLIRLREVSLVSKIDYLTLSKELEDNFNNNKALIERKRKEREFKVKYQYVYLNQHGYLFPKTIFNAYSSGKMTMGEMCRILNVKSKHISGIEQAVMY